MGEVEHHFIEPYKSISSPFTEKKHINGILCQRKRTEYSVEIPSVTKRLLALVIKCLEIMNYLKNH